MTTKPRGGGVKALVVGPLKNELFPAASLLCACNIFTIYGHEYLTYPNINQKDIQET